jgi:hypothetical protein
VENLRTEVQKRRYLTSDSILDKPRTASTCDETDFVLRTSGK